MSGKARNPAAATPVAKPALFRPHLAGPGARFVFSTEAELAINVALVAGRPLLVTGPPGCGKSSIGPAIATVLGWRCHMVSPRADTRMRDLLYRWDDVRRLADAQMAALPRHGSVYVEPGSLWWAFDPQSAARRGAPPGVDVATLSGEPGQAPGTTDAPAVLVLDEVDRADPQLCRDLIETLIARRFQVAELGLTVQAQKPPLAVLTSAGERELPAAVTQACVRLSLPQPDDYQLFKIARMHLPDAPEALIHAVTDRFLRARERDWRRGQTPPGPAALLDVLRVLQLLALQPDNDAADRVIESLLGGGPDEPMPAPWPAEPERAAQAARPAAPGSGVFVCYARADAPFVLPLAGALRHRVDRLWIDQTDIPVGHDWNAAIDAAIDGCGCLLIVLSPQAVASREVLSELRRALDQRKPIVPVLLERCTVPRQLNLLQYIEVNGRSPDDETLLAPLSHALRSVAGPT